MLQTFESGEAFTDFIATRDDIKPQPIRTIELSVPAEGQRLFVINREMVAKGPAFTKVADYLGVPSTFIANTHADLAQDIVKRLAQDEHKEEVIVREGAVVGFRNPDQPYMSAKPVVDTVLKAAPVASVQFNDNDDHFVALFVSDRVTTEAKVGDQIRGGLKLLYSEWMKVPPQIESYSERLVCLNGMVHREYGRSFRLKDNEDFLGEIERAAVDGLTHFTEVVAPRLATATTVQTDGAQAIRRAFNRAHLSPRYYNAVLQAHALEGDDTAYGVIQSFTRAANQFDFRRREKLQDIGGRELVVAAAAHCPRCYSELN